jgi:hypothetical protein
VPVVASLAADAEGRPLNINADTLAEALARALGAKKLIYLTGAPGLLRDADDPSSLVAFAGPAELEALLEAGAVKGGMRPKVEACMRAVAGGVRRTHIIDGRAPDALLIEVFTGGGSGTMIVAEPERRDYERSGGEGGGRRAAHPSWCGRRARRGDEDAAAAVLGGWARARGLPPWSTTRRSGWWWRGGDLGPTLLLASHLDTVPPGDGWTADPYAAWSPTAA